MHFLLLIISPTRIAFCCWACVIRLYVIITVGKNNIRVVLFFSYIALSLQFLRLDYICLFDWILDSFTLLYQAPGGTRIPVPLLRKGITWFTDKNVKFHNPKTNSTLQQAFEGM